MASATGILFRAPRKRMMDEDPPFPIQEEGMMDEGPPFPIQEEGTFIDRKKNAAPKQGLKAGDAEPLPCSPAEDKTLPDSQVDLVDKKRKKRKRRKKKQKKAVQTPSTFSKSKWTDYLWISILCASVLLVSGAAAFTVQKDSAGEVPGIEAQGSEVVTYESVSKDECAAICKVSEPPINMKMGDKEEILDASVRCPRTQKYFGVETCFQDVSVLRVSFKKGREEILFIEHGTGWSHPTTIRMKSEACSLSMEDHSAATTSKPEVSDNDEAKKGVGTMTILGVIGALCLLFFLLVALIFVAKQSRDQGRPFSRVVCWAAARAENGDRDGQA